VVIFSKRLKEKGEGSDRHLCFPSEMGVASSYYARIFQLESDWSNAFI
jgi:hypothetical protein